MDYRGFRIIQEYKEASPGAWRAYMIDDPECVVSDETLIDVKCAIDERLEQRRMLNKAIQHEELKKHLRNMLNEHYCIFMREGFASVEFAEEFIEAAKAVGHNGEAVAAQRWIENELKK